MKLGLFGINLGLLAVDPQVAIDVAVAAEESGWESVWTGEHFALPDPPIPEAPTPPSTPMLEPFIALANVSAHTTSLLLGTGITVLPLYNPFALAKQVVSLDRVSRARVLFGVGAGYLEPEFAAFHVELATRGIATDEMIESLHRIWTEHAPTVRWRERDTGGLRAEPRPTERNGPPLHVGGMSRQAMRRAIRHGDGWFGWSLDPAATQVAIRQLAHIAHGLPRPEGRPRLEISISPPAGLAIDPETMSAYEALGVDRLIVLPPPAVAVDPKLLLTWVLETPSLIVPLLPEA